VGPSDANTIIQQSVEANQRDWDAAPKFDCSEHDRASAGIKTHDDTMILGSPYQRLVTVNGKRLPPGARGRGKTETRKCNFRTKERIALEES
jgi:hypothetical protein